MNHGKRRHLLVIQVVFFLLVFSSCSLAAKYIDNSEQQTQTTSIMDHSEVSPKPTQKPVENASSEVSPIPDHKTVGFSTFNINEKYYNDVNGFVELKLNLPRLDGDYEGIPKINEFFASKEKFFFDELPLEDLKEFNIEVEGEKDNWYRSADYKLEAVLGDIISISADLNGGAGGVGWAGIEGDTFNLNTGEKLSLSDIFKADEEYMDFIYDFVSVEIMDEINNNLQAGYGSGYNFDDAYSGDGYECVRDFDPNNFYLSVDALVVFYPKYALSSGAAGPRGFEIPYESITNILAIDIENDKVDRDSSNKDQSLSAFSYIV